MGTNSNWQKFWALLANPPLHDWDLVIVFLLPELKENLFCWQIWQLFGLYPSDDDRPKCQDHECPCQFSERHHKPSVQGHCLWHVKDVGISTTSSVFLSEYWAFSEHWRLVAITLSTNLLFTFLTIATSASNFLECVGKSLTSVVSSAICESVKQYLCNKHDCTHQWLGRLSINFPSCKYSLFCRFVFLWFVVFHLCKSLILQSL